MSQFQLGMSLTFLKRDLALVIQSTKKNTETTPEKEITVKEYLLIPTTVESSNYVTFNELKKDFDELFGEKSTDSKEATDEIAKQLEQNKSSDGKFDINNIHFYLQTAYLYKKAYYINTETDTNKPDKMSECDDKGTIIANGKNAKWEYAFSIKIDSKDFFSELSTMSINSISFSIWNTNRDVVKKMMTLGTTDDIFKQLEESSK